MKKITEHVYQISLKAVNAFVIEDDGLTLVDTGTPNSADHILDSIRKGGKDPRDIRRIILTHAHPDHSGSAAELKRRLGVPVFAHSEDAALVEKGESGRQPMTLSPGFLNWLIYQLFIRRADQRIEAVAVDKRLSDGDLLPGGIRVIHTPGHSAGHVSLLLEKEGVLIAGDICANMGGPGLSILYEDRALGLRSIQRVAALGFDKAVFGHGKALTEGASEKIKAKFG